MKKIICISIVMGALLVGCSNADKIINDEHKIDESDKTQKELILEEIDSLTIKEYKDGYINCDYDYDKFTYVYDKYVINDGFIHKSSSYETPIDYKNIDRDEIENHFDKMVKKDIVPDVKNMLVRAPEDYKYLKEHGEEVWLLSYIDDSEFFEKSYYEYSRAIINEYYDEKVKTDSLVEVGLSTYRNLSYSEFIDTLKIENEKYVDYAEPLFTFTPFVWNVDSKDYNGIALSFRMNRALLIYDEYGNYVDSYGGTVYKEMPFEAKFVGNKKYFLIENLLSGRGTGFYRENNKLFDIVNGKLVETSSYVDNLYVAQPIEYDYSKYIELDKVMFSEEDNNLIISYESGIPLNIAGQDVSMKKSYTLDINNYSTINFNSYGEFIEEYIFDDSYSDQLFNSNVDKIEKEINREVIDDYDAEVLSAFLTRVSKSEKRDEFLNVLKVYYESNDQIYNSKEIITMINSTL